MNCHIVPFYIESVFICNNLNLPNDKILNEIKKLEWQESGENLLQTKSNKIFNKLNSKEIIKNKIRECVKEYIKVYQYDCDFSFATEWATWTKAKGYSKMHLHKGFWLSACYYLNGKKEDKFNIIFETDDKKYFDINNKSTNLYNTHKQVFLVKEGDLIIFPSYLKHGIGLNQSNCDRYSIAFNFYPKGILGFGDGQFNFNMENTI